MCDYALKVRDCLKLLREESTLYEVRLRVMQALLNADKLHHLTDRERRAVEKSIKWGELTPVGVKRLPLDE